MSYHSEYLRQREAARNRQRNVNRLFLLALLAVGILLVLVGHLEYKLKQAELARPLQGYNAQEYYDNGIFVREN